MPEDRPASRCRLHPSDRSSVPRVPNVLLLEQLKGRVHVPTVLFTQATPMARSLCVHGVLDAEHNYRPKSSDEGCSMTTARPIKTLFDRKIDRRI